MKLIPVSLAAIVIVCVACLLVQRAVIKEQGIDLTKNAMRSILLSAESARGSISEMRKDSMFVPLNVSRADVASGEFRHSKLYQTIPVVAAWRSIRAVADKEGYRFHIAAHQPRNPENVPTPDEEAILSAFEQGGKQDYFSVDEKRGDIVYARPVILSQECLTCHGDPQSSKSGDGKDMLGFPMENWKNGQVHGAFILRSSVSRIAPVIQAGMNRTLLWSIPITFVVGLVVFFLVNNVGKELSQVAVEITRSSQTVAVATSQISSGTQLLAQNASKQAAALEETSAASEQILAIARNNTDRSAQATVAMEQVEATVRAGGDTAGSVIGSINEINSASQNVLKIINTIDGIAFQTNILALNAAVEAARAGEAGLGFAVVADEVRNLAGRCTEASKETSALVKESLAKAGHAVEVSHELSRSFQSIIQHSVTMKNLIAEISSASGEQAQGSNQITHSLKQIDQVTQDIAANTEESAAASSEMAQEARALDGLVVQLNELVMGRKG